MSHEPDTAAQQMLDAALRMITHPYCTQAAAKDILLGVYQLGITDGKMVAFDAAARVTEQLFAEIPMERSQ